MSQGSNGTTVQQPNQVSGQSALWALIALGLDAMTHPSIFEIFGKDGKLLFEGTFKPHRSSPLVCVADILFNLACFGLIGVKALRKTVFGSRPASGEEGSNRAKPNAIKMRLLVFVLGVLPQAIKIFAMRGIPITQVCAAMFLGSSMISSMARLLGISAHSLSLKEAVDELKDSKQTAHNYLWKVWPWIIFVPAAAHVVASAWIWYLIAAHIYVSNQILAANVVFCKFVLNLCMIIFGLQWLVCWATRYQSPLPRLPGHFYLWFTSIDAFFSFFPQSANVSAAQKDLAKIEKELHQIEAKAKNLAAKCVSNPQSSPTQGVSDAKQACVSAVDSLLQHNFDQLKQAKSMIQEHSSFRRFIDFISNPAIPRAALLMLAAVLSSIALAFGFHRVAGTVCATTSETDKNEEDWIEIQKVMRKYIHELGCDKKFIDTIFDMLNSRDRNLVSEALDVSFPEIRKPLLPETKNDLKSLQETLAIMDQTFHPTRLEAGDDGLSYSLLRLPWQQFRTTTIECHQHFPSARWNIVGSRQLPAQPRRPENAVVEWSEDPTPRHPRPRLGSAMFGKSPAFMLPGWMINFITSMPGEVLWVAFCIFNLITAATYYLLVFDGEHTFSPGWASIFG
ncbi:MAG: hypothetical protein Q9227_002138 [Pyrenula ochraceoflavens]